MLFEHLCEFGLVFKAYSIADGADGHGGIIKEALGLGDAMIAQINGYVLAEYGAEPVFQAGLAHANLPGNFSNG